MLFSTFFFIPTLLAVNAVALEERAAATYVQQASGSASFTEYSGCGSPGDDNPLLSSQTTCTELLFFDNSLWHNGEWVHCSNEPTCLWRPARPWAWRCLWSLFPFDRHR